MTYKIVFSFFILTGMVEMLKAQSHGSIMSSEMVAGDGVRITRVSTGRIIHRFFDTSPLSPSAGILLCFVCLMKINHPDRETPAKW